MNQEENLTLFFIFPIKVLSLSLLNLLLSHCDIGFDKYYRASLRMCVVREIGNTSQFSLNNHSPNNFVPFDPVGSRARPVL